MPGTRGRVSRSMTHASALDVAVMRDVAVLVEFNSSAHAPASHTSAAREQPCGHVRSSRSAAPQRTVRGCTSKKGETKKVAPLLPGAALPPNPTQSTNCRPARNLRVSSWNSQRLCDRRMPLAGGVMAASSSPRPPARCARPSVASQTGQEGARYPSASASQPPVHSKAMTCPAAAHTAGPCTATRGPTKTPKPLGPTSPSLRHNS